MVTTAVGDRGHSTTFLCNGDELKTRKCNTDALALVPATQVHAAGTTNLIKLKFRLHKCTNGSALLIRTHAYFSVVRLLQDDLGPMVSVKATP